MRCVCAGDLPVQQQRQRRQQHDLDSMLGMVLGSLDATEQQDTACALHRASRSSRSTAIGTIKHLSLVEYERGRAEVLALVSKTEPGAIPAAIARAAAVQMLPWRILGDVSTAGTLTSLAVTAPQVQHLLAGGRTSAAAAAADPAAALLHLAATLAGLRSLKVEQLGQEVQLRPVGHMVGSCGRLTQLVLKGYFPEEPSSRPLLDGMREAAATAAAVAAAGAESTFHGNLLRLDVDVCMPKMAAALLDGTAASSLTAVTFGATVEAGTLDQLAACSGLRALEVTAREWPPPAVPSQLQQLKGLTQLVLHDGVVWGMRPCQVPAGVWVLTQLCHLALDYSSVCVLPQEVSALKALTCLDLSNTCVQELPAELGSWLPQLEVLLLRWDHNGIIPQGLDRLTCLSVGFQRDSSFTSVQHLVQLQKLDLRGEALQGPFNMLSSMTALQELRVDMDTGAAVSGLTPLPLLRHLVIYAKHTVQVAAQLIGSAQHLTTLIMYEGQEGLQAGDLQQLGAVPKLRELVLYMKSLADLVAAGPWLQQRAHLTALCVYWDSQDEVFALGHLPPHLEQLGLRGAVVGWGGVPSCVVQLAGLRELWLDVEGVQQLPPWLASLQGLSVLAAEGSCLEGGMEVLGQLPQIRRRHHRWMGEPRELALLCAAPHLCWPENAGAGCPEWRW
jgi:hypothetical protein